ncbi:MAG: N-acetylmuramoyl-L-alanine amidase [bacterium]|nr:N-acetylmuramoyl-L-alanine amidase [bacterium]
MLSLALAGFVLTCGIDGASAQIDVWIDPGHGGHDPGALGHDGAAAPNEMDLNSGVAYYLDGALTGLGYIVAKTQNSDTTYFTPRQRALIANGELPNDLGMQSTSQMLLSVHMNSSTNAVARGTETWYPATRYYAKKKIESVEAQSAANQVQSALMSYANLAFLFCSADRGTKAGNFAVLKRTKNLALLVEVCFISNECQFRNISTDGDQALIADGIAVGISYCLEPTLSGRVRVPVIDTDPASVAKAGEAPITESALGESFEETAFPPAGWSVLTAGGAGSPTWERVTLPGHASDGVAAAWVGGGSPQAADAWLISPPIVPSGDLSAVRFKWAGSRIWAHAVDASLGVRNVGDVEWTTLWSLSLDEPMADPFIFRERAVGLGDWAGATVELAFRVTGADGADFMIDEVALGAYEPTGPAANDRCESASRLFGSFDVDGVNCYATDDLSDGSAIAEWCGSTDLGGPDVVYELRPAAGDTLTAHVDADWGASLYLLEGCAANAAVACAGQQEDSRGPTDIFHVFERSGLHYLVVDGESGSCGPFRLVGRMTQSATAVPQDSVDAEENVRLEYITAAGQMILQASYPADVATEPIFEVYDISGKRLMQRRVPGSGGHCEVQWNMRDQNGAAVASGMYVARLRVGPRVAVRKLAILR